MKKRTILSVAVLVALTKTSISFAVINEKPIIDKQYNDFLIFDNNGKQNVSFQDSDTGKKQHYYFNEGALIDGSNGGLHATILSHNWGNGMNYDTAKIFHIGESKDFTIKQYAGYAAMEAKDGAGLDVYGGNIIIENASSSGNFINTSAGIYAEDGGQITIDANSLYIGNKKEDLGKFNAPALSAMDYDSSIDIDLKGQFIAENIDSGILVQELKAKKTSVNLNADKGIIFKTHRSESASATALFGTAIYNISYDNELGSSEISLNSNFGDIFIDAQSYGVYGYGNVQNFFSTLNGTISLKSQEKYGIYVNGYYDGSTSKTSFNAKNINIHGHIQSVSGKKTVFEIAATDNLSLSTDDSWAVTLYESSDAKFSANKINYSGSIFIDDSKLLSLADFNYISGLVKANEGGDITFASIIDGDSGRTTITTNGYSSVVATSEKDISKILFKQESVISSQGNDTRYQGKKDEYSEATIYAKHNSEIVLNKAKEIYGDIIALRDTSVASSKGGKISINSTEDAQIKGDVFAINDAEITLSLNGINSVLEAQIDDYHDLKADGSSNIYRDFIFENNLDVKNTGSVILNLNQSTWIARGQSFLKELNFVKGGIVDLSYENNNSVTIDKLTGNGNFNMLLNSADHSVSDMLYIGTNEGHQTINIVGGIKGGLENVSEANPLRFATVANDRDNLPNVLGSGISAYTKDAGVFDLTYTVAKEKFDVNDSENEVYNGSGSGENSDKVGNDYVESDLVNENSVNWIITGVSQKQKSNSALSIIDLSRVNYANAVYMDRLNKRLGEACFIDGENGFWFRSRYDRIGKEEAFHTNNTMFNWGYNHKGEYQSGQNHYGVVFDYMYGKASYDNVSGSGDVKRVGLWFYDTWLGANGFYSDVVLKAARLDNDFDIYASSSQENIHGEFDNFVYSLSLEGGYKQKFFEDFYIEPQLQMQYAYVTDADYSTSQGTEVSLDSIDSLIGRLGIRLGKELASSNLYIKADVLSEFLGKQKLKAYDQTGCFDEEYQNDGVWFDIGMGFSYSMNKNAYVFFDVENSFGNDNEDSYQLNLGFNVSF